MNKITGDKLTLVEITAAWLLVLIKLVKLVCRRLFMRKIKKMTYKIVVSVRAPKENWCTIVTFRKFSVFIFLAHEYGFHSTVTVTWAGWAAWAGGAGAGLSVRFSNRARISFTDTLGSVVSSCIVSMCPEDDDE